MTFKTKTAKSTIIPLLTLGVQWVKSVSHYKDFWIGRDIGFSDDKDIQTQLRYQKLLFPHVRTQWKMYFFVPSVSPCIHHSCCVISGRHTSADCLGLTLVAGHCTTCRQWHNKGGSKGDICPRAQHFGGAKLRSKCYILITKCQMSADASNYNLQNVECHCQISSRSPRFAKRAIMNLSDVSRRSFCLQQLTLEYYRRSTRPGSNEVIHVKLRKRMSARFELFSSFMFLCD